MIENFKVLPELEDALRKTDEECRLLEEQIETHGGAHTPGLICTIGELGSVLFAGHNRRRICFRLGFPFPVQDSGLHFDTVDAAVSAVVQDQLGQRNLSPDQKLCLAVRDGWDPREGLLRIREAEKLKAEAPDLFLAVIEGRQRLWVAMKDLATRTGLSNLAPRPFTDKGRIHIVIGDTQVKPGVPTDHLTWIGRYIADNFVKQNVAIIHVGDHWDMPSLSLYDVGKKASEGLRYEDDIEAGNAAIRLLNAPIEKAAAGGKWKQLERHFLLGNHENRIARAINDDAKLAGTLSFDDLDLKGWTRHDFLAPVPIDGITYSHYFIAQNTGKPLSGENVEARLKTVGTSFTMGHQQGRKWAERNIANGRRICGLILGSTYLHDEEYRGPQGNANWRGIAVCHQVENGQYDPMFVSLDYLCRKYEGKPLSEFLRQKSAA